VFAGVLQGESSFFNPLASSLDKQRKYRVSLYLVLTNRPAESQKYPPDKRYSHAVIDFLQFHYFPQNSRKICRPLSRPQEYNKNTT